MDVNSCCLACLIGQIEKTYHRLKPKIPNEEIVRVQKVAMQKLALISQKPMPYYGQALYQTIHDEMGIADPYFALKVLYNEKALALVPQLKKIIQTSSQSLQTAIGLSIIGNTIDFGTPHEINLSKDVDEFSLDKIVINDFPKLETHIENAKSLLIIGDNCGECVFDYVLLEYIHKYYPEKDLFYAVRGGPMINDCTMNDIEKIGFEKICNVFESSASPGVILEQSSQDFQNVFASADLIFSKGQGNFEALDNIIPAHGNMYFLLKAKCNLVASLLDVPLGSLILSSQDTVISRVSK